MPGSLDLRYLPAAQDDLISIVNWISLDNQARALSFVDRLEEGISQLEHHPLLGRLPRNGRLREQGYRVLVVESYLVFYIVQGQTVFIHRVVHGSRNLDSIV